MIGTSQNRIEFQESAFGREAIIIGNWQTGFEQQIRQSGAVALELNLGKGWSGNDVSFLSDLPFLRSLTIHDFTLKNVEAVHDLRLLESLILSTYVKHPIRFDCFHELKECAFEWTRGSDSLFGTLTLEDLFINRYSGTSSQPFGNLRRLRKLGILNSRIKEIRGLSKLTSLSELRLGGLRGLESFDAIESLQNLEFLWVQSCRRVRSLAPINAVQGLKKLILEDMGEIDSLRPLQGLDNLDELYFTGDTKAIDGDLDFLKSMKRLKNVWYRNRRHYSIACEKLMELLSQRSIVMDT